MARNGIFGQPKLVTDTGRCHFYHRMDGRVAFTRTRGDVYWPEQVRARNHSRDRPRTGARARGRREQTQS